MSETAYYHQPHILRLERHHEHHLTAVRSIKSTSTADHGAEVINLDDAAPDIEDARGAERLVPQLSDWRPAANLAHRHDVDAECPGPAGERDTLIGDVCLDAAERVMAQLVDTRRGGNSCQRTENTSPLELAGSLRLLSSRCRCLGRCRLG